MSTCTLDPEELPARLGAWRALLAEATSRDAGSYAFPPDPAVAARIAELATAETQCCSFFRFALTMTATEVTLRIDASPPR